MEKIFLYHRVPQDMAGNVLYPLNVLKDLYPELYSKKVKKYDDRPHIMRQIIPTFSCAWNDVLYFSAAHPKLIKDALIEAGFNPPPMKFFQVDPQMLHPEKTTVYLFRDKSPEGMNIDNFSKYDPNALEEYAIIPEETKDYFKKMVAQNKNPLMFWGISHILYKGTIDISDLPVITV